MLTLIYDYSWMISFLFYDKTEDNEIMVYQYDYPRPMFTADILVLRFFDGSIQILLIKRKNPPFQDQWALPGGYIEMNETSFEAARRELKEETALETSILFPLLVADKPERDPRGRTISHVFCSISSPPFPKVVSGDDADDIHWFSLHSLPQLAFDHQMIIDQAMDELLFHLTVRLKILAFLEEEFPEEILYHLLKVLGIRNTMADQILERCVQLNIVTACGEDRYRRTITPTRLIGLGSRTLLEA